MTKKKNYIHIYIGPIYANANNNNDNNNNNVGCWVGGDNDDTLPLIPFVSGPTRRCVTSHFLLFM